MSLPASSQKRAILVACGVVDVKSKDKDQTLQSEKFKAMAKEVEADGNEQTFDATLKSVAKIKKKVSQKTWVWYLGTAWRLEWINYLCLSGKFITMAAMCYA